MNIKRAVLIGSLFWVLIFFEVSILMFGLKIQILSMTYYLIHGAVVIIFVLTASFAAFIEKK